MGLIYDDPDPAALTLTRLAADESEGPGGLDGRMNAYLGDLEQRNGPACLELVAITPARVHFKALDDLARASGVNPASLLDAAEVEALEALSAPAGTDTRRRGHKVSVRSHKVLLGSRSYGNV
jgi:hypothetical protein